MKKKIFFIILLIGISVYPVIGQNITINGANIDVGSGANVCPGSSENVTLENGGTITGDGELCGGATPVELTSFTANVVDGSILLNWTTATEVNNYGFSLERKSTIENREWEEIGFVDGHGNSNSPKEYSFLDNSVTSNVSYRLKQIDTDGAFEYSDVVSVAMELSKEFKLIQNYPNPFNPTTSIAFTLPTSGFVTLKVYNTIGEEVAELLNKNIEAGNHNVIFNAFNLPTGAYFYRISADNHLETKKMLLIK